MKRTVWLWQLIGFAVTALGGTLLHFLYDLTSKAAWVTPFSGVNESTWEHMKLLFWPMFIYAIAQSFFFKGYEKFWCVKLRGTLLGLGAIPILFYTYNGVIGESPDWVNITIFFVAAAIAFTYETRQLNSRRATCRSPRTAFALLLAIAAMFVIFTFRTPELELFRDPLTGTYGI